MKDFSKTTEEKKERVMSWLFVLVMRLYGQNIYSDESYVWKILELENIEDIDNFFGNVLSEFKYKRQDIAKLYKLLSKIEDIKSR